MPSAYAPTSMHPHPILTHPEQAAFDPRILASVCFFATDIHSATLGKGSNDDSLARVKKGDLTGKGELVVCPFSSHPIDSRSIVDVIAAACLDDFWQAGRE